MLSDDEARELRELQRRVFRQGDALGTAELRRLDELAQRAEDARVSTAAAPSAATAREKDLRDLLDGIGDEAGSAEEPGPAVVPAPRRRKAAAALIGALALVAVLTGVFFAGRTTAPAVPASLQQVAETGKNVAAAQGWVTWNYAGSLNGIDYFAGVPDSGDRCVLPVSLTLMPQPAEALCTPPKTTEMVVQTDIQTIENGARTMFTTSLVWNADSRAHLSAAAEPVIVSLTNAAMATAFNDLDQDRERALEITNWDLPPTLLDFSLTTGGLETPVPGGRAVRTSYWAGTAGGARAVVVATAENTVIAYLDDQQDPLGGTRAPSLDLDPRLMTPDSPAEETPSDWFWRVDWPVDGTPTMVPVWRE